MSPAIVCLIRQTIAGDMTQCYVVKNHDMHMHSGRDYKMYREHVTTMQMIKSTQGSSFQKHNKNHSNQSNTHTHTHTHTVMSVYA